MKGDNNVLPHVCIYNLNNCLLLLSEQKILAKEMSWEFHDLSSCIYFMVQYWVFHGRRRKKRVCISQYLLKFFMQVCLQNRNTCCCSECPSVMCHIREGSVCGVVHGEGGCSETHKNLCS